jgi:hypothetical protein
MPARKPRTEAQIYQLKITLKNTKPPIWRRVQVPHDISLATLHDIIQDTMGWEDCHMHQFKIGKIYFGLSYPDDFDGITTTKDEERATLGEVIVKPKTKFVYEYDFGDSWEHEVVLEKMLAPEPGVKYPRCIDGKRACPPEDCGGAWGYAGFVEAIQNPKHPEHEDMMEWIGDSFDPEAFDLEKVNRALRRIRR